jgi:hypothetical protein
MLVLFNPSGKEIKSKFERINFGFFQNKIIDIVLMIV